MQKSSTYNDRPVFESKQFIMLFILMLNKVVYKMLPCGTPCDSPKVSDKFDPTLTWIDLFARKLSTKFANPPLSPNTCRSRKIPYFQVVSKAFSKSKNTATTCSFLTKASRIKVSSLTKLSMVLRSERKPD